MPPGGSPLRTGGEGLNRVMNVGHRGARGFAPENTLSAFAKAAELGCDMVELDVHRSRDGALVVHHDDQLTRCTDAASRWPGRDNYFISDFSLAELRTLDAGSWFVDEISRPPAERQEFLRSLSDSEIASHIGPSIRKEFQSGDIRIPTLDEVLTNVLPTPMLVNIELKTLPRMYPHLARDVVQLVRDRGCEDRVLISSFDHQQLVIVRELSTRIATAVLSCDRLAFPGRYLDLLAADAYNPGCYGDYDTVGLNSTAGALDLRTIHDVRLTRRGVNVWTCNEPDDMERLIAAGVTGIISDYPNRVQAVLARFPTAKM